jgi:peroxiredoxin
VALLKDAHTASHILILADEAIEISGQELSQTQHIKILQGRQNQAFVEYAAQHPKRENALSAWRYLAQMYSQDSLFLGEEQTQVYIQKEMERIQTEDANFIANLPKESYVRWFLPLRRLLSSVAGIAQYRPEEIPATREALREINYADERLYKSGLLKEAIENHIWFIENSSGSLGNVFEDLNQSIDLVIEQLKDDSYTFNLITQKWFEVLEKRSLFTSSEYLSKRLLAKEDCGCLDPSFEKQLHKYGKIAKGAIASDIVFSEFTYFPEGIKATKMSDLQAEYYVLVFAAGWCGHCTKEIPQISDLYPKLKEKNMEVIMVSLDEKAKDFAHFAAPLPFISTTDYQKWDSKPVEDYQVYATPTYFLLDKELKIILKPKNIEHLNAFINQYL